MGRVVRVKHLLAETTQREQQQFFPQFKKSIRTSTDGQCSSVGGTGYK